MRDRYTHAYKILMFKLQKTWKSNLCELLNSCLALMKWTQVKEKLKKKVAGM